MITTGLNVLANFCENVYPADSLVNESWHGLTQATLKTALDSHLTTRQADAFDVISFQNAPEDTDLKTKYPDGLVYINIPYNMIDKVGMQKYGAHHPGKIIGYNNAKQYALVIFYNALYSTVNVNIYSYKYLSPLTEELMAAGASYTVKGLKQFLTSNSGLRFTAGRIRLQGKQLLAKSVGTAELDMYITVTSSMTSLRRPIVDTLKINLPNGFLFDRNGRIPVRQLTFDSRAISTSDILIKIQSALDSYHDIIAQSMSVAAGLRLIRNASSYYPGESTVIDNLGSLVITRSAGDKFTGIQDFLGDTYRAGAAIDMQSFRALIPTKLIKPKGKMTSIIVDVYKDVKTSKAFLLVTVPEENPMVLTPSSTAYTYLANMIKDEGKEPEYMTKLKKAYNKLTSNGKELFMKYLAHPNA